MPPEQTSYDTKKIILIGVLLLVIVGLVGFLIFKKVTGPSDGTTDKNLFPYDGTVLPPSSGSSGTGTDIIPNPITETSLTSTTGDRLRVIANYPVTAAYPFLTNRTIGEPKIDEKTGRTIIISKVVPINNVRFNAKQNGFLVDAEVTKNIISITQKTNTPLPNSEEVWFGNRGNTVVYRSWDALKRTIVSFSGSLPSLNTLNYCQKPFTTLLKTKSKGDEVKELQKYINVKLSLNLTIDGIYGKKISDAVKPLQKILSLPESGSYDQSLIDAINADCTNIIATRTQSLSGIQKITGDFMPEGILRGTVSPDGTQVFYLKPTLTGVVGMISTITGKNERQVFSSPLTEWKPQWINDTTITMTTLPSSEADGYLYFLNPVTGDFQKILGPVRGLTTLSNPSGTTLLLSSTANKTISLATYTVATGVQTPRDLNTLTDKCVWQNDTIVVCAVPQKLTTGQYPDDWYQGNISFADAFWSIDTTQNTTLNLFTPGEAFDAYRLVLSPDANYLYFINRLNGSLWSYRIGEE